MNIILYFGTLVTLAVIDSVWLFLTGAMYKNSLGSIFNFSVSFPPAIVFYLIYTLGVVVFVLAPAIQKGSSFAMVFLLGALFGVVAYVTYDLTNQATILNWPISITLMDITWGAFLTGISSVIVYFIYAHFK